MRFYLTDDLSDVDLFRTKSSIPYPEEFKVTKLCQLLVDLHQMLWGDRIVFRDLWHWDNVTEIRTKINQSVCEVLNIMLIFSLRSSPSPLWCLRCVVQCVLNRSINRSLCILEFKMMHLLVIAFQQPFVFRHQEWDPFLITSHLFKSVNLCTDIMTKFYIASIWRDSLITLLCQRFEMSIKAFDILLHRNSISYSWRWQICRDSVFESFVCQNRFAINNLNVGKYLVFIRYNLVK